MNSFNFRHWFLNNSRASRWVTFLLNLFFRKNSRANELNRVWEGTMGKSMKTKRKQKKQNGMERDDFTVLREEIKSVVWIMKDARKFTCLWENTKVLHENGKKGRNRVDKYFNGRTRGIQSSVFRYSSSSSSLSGKFTTCQSRIRENLEGRSERNPWRLWWTQRVFVRRILEYSRIVSESDDSEEDLPERRTG